MAGYCVIVASTDRARMFVTRDAVHPEIESGPNLIESEEMQILGGTKEGVSNESLLTRKLVGDSLHVLRRDKGHHLVLVAPAPLLRELRKACAHFDCSGITIREFEGDLITLTPQTLQETLAQAGIVPKSIEPTGLRDSD